VATSAQDQQSTAGQAKEQASQVAGQAQEKASEVAGQAKEQAQHAAGQAKSQIRTQVDQRSTQAGEQVSTQAQDLRTVAEKLREEGKDGPAKVADQVAGRVESVGNYLTQADADRILHDVEDFGRQRPWAVIAAGVGLGLAASRFLKASSADRYSTRSSSGQLARAGQTGYGYGAGPTGGTTGTGYTLGAGTGTGEPVGQTGGGRFERGGLETETERVRDAATGGVNPAGPAPTTGGPPTSTGAL
jgi:uncharacterized protein YjbJ (UPF0337 family)